MATFPAIVADHPITEETKVREQRAGLGDGVEYITRFGLNPVDTTWRVKWSRLSDSERSTIESFLAARAADGEPFDWTPPDAAIAQRFRVEQWEPARTTPTGWALDLMFKRVYEVGGPILAPTKVTCTVDATVPDLPIPLTPCSTVLNARGGFMWVQQFLSGVYRPNGSYNPWQSSTINPKGTRIYTAFYYYPIAESTSTGYLVVACFDSSGNHLWTTRVVEAQQTAGANERIHMAASNTGVGVALDRSSGSHRVLFFTSGGALSWAKVYALGNSIRCLKYSATSDCLVFMASAATLGTQITLAKINVSNGSLTVSGRLTIGAGWESMQDIAELQDGSFVAVGIFGTMLRISADWLTRLNLATLTRSGSPVDLRRVAAAGSGFVAHNDGALFNLSSAFALSWRTAGAPLASNLGIIGMEVDPSGITYLAIAGSAQFTTSGISFLGNWFNGSMCTIANDGSQLLSGSASQSLFDNPTSYIIRKSISDRCMNPGKNQFVSAYETGIGLISHSISFPCTETRLTLSGGVDQARIIGDCSPPTIAVDNSGVSTSALSWTWSNPSLSISNLSLTTVDLTSSVTWTKASRTL